MSGDGNFNVVLLVEHQLSRADAEQVHALHESLEDHVVYHVLLPVEDAASRIEAAMGSLAGGEAMASPAMVMDKADIDAVRRDCEERSQAELAETLTHLRASGADAAGGLVHGHPIDGLADKIAAVDGREAIILTRPHVVAEFFHLDWTSKAQRRVGVPVLHLLEHESPAEQAGGAGEGISGL